MTTTAPNLKYKFCCGWGSYGTITAVATGGFDCYCCRTSTQSIVDIEFNLIDLKSRCKNFLLQSIEKPDDELMFALILKNLSDRQILLEKKLIHYIVKRIDRSYGKIFDFIYKIDEMSLKKKKSIDFKTIKDVLGQ